MAIIGAPQGSFLRTTISAQNTFTEAFLISSGLFHVGISGISGDTVHVQSSLDDGTTWRDIASYTVDSTLTGEMGADCRIRVGVKTGNYSAGTIVAEIKQNEVPVR